MFSEEMSRSFLPLLAGQLFESQNTFQISSEIALGIPITLFMLVVAIVTPGAGTLTDRYGPRRIFVIGALLAVTGYALTIFTGSYLGFLAARLQAAGEQQGGDRCRREGVHVRPADLQLRRIYLLRRHRAQGGPAETEKAGPAEEGKRGGQWQR